MWVPAGTRTIHERVQAASQQKNSNEMRALELENMYQNRSRIPNRLQNILQNRV